MYIGGIQEKNKNNKRSQKRKRSSITGRGGGSYENKKLGVDNFKGECGFCII